MRRRVFSGLAFVFSCVAANAALVQWGIVPVGFGLMAPAGVYFIGLSFTARDFAHEHLGRRGVVALIGVAALLSSLLSPRYALASGVALFVSEMSDLAVYEPLRRRSKALAILASNTVGAVVDSALFLLLAFGSLEYVLGQIVGKTWVTLAIVPFFLRFRRWAPALLFCIALPAAGQVVSVNAAWLHNPYASEPVAEAFVASPPLAGVRAYTILSFSEIGAPTVLARVGWLRPGLIAPAVGVGFISLPNNRKPGLSLSAAVFVGKGRVRPYAVVARERTPEWTTTTFVGVNVGVWFKR